MPFSCQLLTSFEEEKKTLAAKKKIAEFLKISFFHDISTNIWNDIQTDSQDVRDQTAFMLDDRKSGSVQITTISGPENCAKFLCNDLHFIFTLNLLSFVLK